MHLYLHLDGSNIAIFDYTDPPVVDPGYPQENGVNAFTRNVLFSREVWKEVGVDRRNRQQLEGRPRLHPGVYRIVEVRSFPEKRADSPDKFWLDIARVP